MNEYDHQHRSRGLNWQIPQALVNLCFQVDLFRKQASWTYPSEQITIIRDKTNLKDPQSKTNHRKSTQTGLGWGWPTLLVGRPASQGHRSAFASHDGFPPPLRINLHRGSRSVRIEASDGSLPWIYGPTGLLVPPIKGLPYLVQMAIIWRSTKKRDYNLKAPYTNIHRHS
jgi:hypothetical protein